MVYSNSSAAADIFAATSAALAASSIALIRTHPDLAAVALKTSLQLYTAAATAGGGAGPVANATHCQWSNATAAAAGGGGVVGGEQQQQQQGHGVPQFAPPLLECEVWSTAANASVWRGYPSTTALDDMAWAAAWLYKATGKAEREAGGGGALGVGRKG